ncbi:MAG: hypothetical protein AB1420_14185 [Bacillota bacterium]
MQILLFMFLGFICAILTLKFYFEKNTIIAVVFFFLTIYAYYRAVMKIKRG